jgi:2-polyprenyl-3-methyl-5-hydroxy-6-metoxy-1,4-benzoquinol methylase
MIRKFSPPAPGDRVLDIGCGSGVIANVLASMGAITTGIDANASAVEYARRTFKRPDLDFRLGLVEEIDIPDGTVDGTYCLELVEHIYEHQARQLFSTIHRLSRPGGTLTVTTPNYRGTWPFVERALDTLRLVPRLEGEQHVTRFTRQRLQQLLEVTGWRIEVLTTFSTVAPFLSVLGWSLAERVALIEDRLDLCYGNILFAVARKTG